MEQLLKSFTFLEIDEIRDVVEEHKKAPEQRAAQTLLAETMTKALHGSEGLETARAATALLFGKQPDGPLSADQVLAMAGDAPVATVARSDVLNRSVVDLTVRITACKSKGEQMRAQDADAVTLITDSRPLVWYQPKRAV